MHANLTKYMRNCYLRVKDTKSMEFFGMVEALNFDHLFILSSCAYPGNNYKIIDSILSLELGGQDLNFISITCSVTLDKPACFPKPQALVCKGGIIVLSPDLSRSLSDMLFI